LLSQNLTELREPAGMSVYSEEGIMQQHSDFDLIMGLCRCSEHALHYRPKQQNYHRVYFFVDAALVPSNLLCGACLQQGKIRHGGLIISEESREQRLVAFRAHSGYQLSDEDVQSAKRIWPR